MAYFARNDPGKAAHRGKGMQVRNLSPSRLKRGVDRDEKITAEISAIHGDAIHKPGGDFLLSKLDTTKAVLKGKNCKTALTARTHQSNIFAEARLSTPPKLRIRPQFTNDELSKLAPADNRRSEAAEKMTANPTLVDKMYACNYPQPHGQEVYVPAKKRHIDGLPPAKQEVEVAGFRNMGQLSKPVRYGHKAHVINDPFIPELPVRKEKMPRYGGKQSEFNPITNLPQQNNPKFNATNTPRQTNDFNF